MLRFTCPKEADDKCPANARGGKYVLHENMEIAEQWDTFKVSNPFYCGHIVSADPRLPNSYKLELQVRNMLNVELFVLLMPSNKFEYHALNT